MTDFHFSLLHMGLTLILALAAAACALYARRQHTLASRLLRKDLRLEIGALRATLRQDADVARRNHDAYKRYINATFAIHDLNGSDEHLQYLKDWENNNTRLQKAASALADTGHWDPHFPDTELENKLIELKIMERDLERITRGAEHVILDNDLRQLQQDKDS